MVATLAVIESVIWLTRLSGTTRSPGRRPSNILFLVWEALAPGGNPLPEGGWRLPRAYQNSNQKIASYRLWWTVQRLLYEFHSRWHDAVKLLPRKRLGLDKQLSLLSFADTDLTGLSAVLFFADLWFEPTPLAGMKELRWAEFFRPTSFMKGSRRSQYNEQ